MGESNEKETLSEKVASESAVLSALIFFFVILMISSGWITQVFTRGNSIDFDATKLVFSQQECVITNVGFISSSVCNAPCDSYFKNSKSWKCIEPTEFSVGTSSICSSFAEVVWGYDAAMDGCALHGVTQIFATVLLLVSLFDCLLQYGTIPVLLLTDKKVNASTISRCAFVCAVIMLVLGFLLFIFSEMLISHSTYDEAQSCNAIFSEGAKVCVTRGSQSVFVVFVVILSTMNVYLTMQRKNNPNIGGIEALFGVENHTNTKNRRSRSDSSSSLQSHITTRSAATTSSFYTKNQVDNGERGTTRPSSYMFADLPDTSQWANESRQQPRRQQDEIESHVSESIASSMDSDSSGSEDSDYEEVELSQEELQQLQEKQKLQTKLDETNATAQKSNESVSDRHFASRGSPEKQGASRSPQKPKQKQSRSPPKSKRGKQSEANNIVPKNLDFVAEEVD